MYKNKINTNLLKTSASPIEEIISLAQKQKASLRLPIIDLSQAAPNLPPPLGLRKAIGKATLITKNHQYGSILGKIELRHLITKHWNAIYQSNIIVNEVAVTSGCNQAFCAAIASVAKAGDSVILPTPWYFNHKMWLDMQGIKIIELPCTHNLLPDLNVAKKLITKSVKAIILVTPNNPTGQEYPDKLIHEFALLAKEKNSALIIDETYRDFISKSSRLHTLFQTDDWRHWLIHIYSFSKVYRITGNRVGALITSQYRLKQIEKFLDTVTICPNQLAQEAAIYGLKYLHKFVEHQRSKIIDCKEILKAEMRALPDWKILSIGAFFAYIKYPMLISSQKFSKLLLAEVSLLVIPGSFFETPEMSSKSGDQNFRLAFANVKKSRLVEVVERLKLFELLFYEKYCLQVQSSLEGG